jgi:poly-gamma-glutamate synthesis protein (capsule biosynthesis protein)
MKIILLIGCLLLCTGGFAQEDTLIVLFAGDVMQHQSQIDAARRGAGYQYDTCFHFVKKYIDSADLAVANLEVTLAGEPYSGYPQFCSPDELAVTLQKVGFDVLITANNHSCDKGAKGIRRTIQVLDSLGLAHTGTFRSQAERDSVYPLLWEQKGFRLALLNYTYGTNGLPAPSPHIVNLIDTVKMAADILAAKALLPDMIIANMHWGEEYKLHPNREQVRLTEFLTRQGVRMVIGSHPHVLQRMECRHAADSITQNVVVYSLGNLISNMRAKHTDGGMMAYVRLIKCAEEIRIDECGYRLVWVYKPVVNGHRQFILLPVADFEHKAEFFREAADFQKMNAFAKDMRNLFNQETRGFVEYK